MGRALAVGAVMILLFAPVTGVIPSSAQSITTTESPAALDSDTPPLASTQPNTTPVDLSATVTPETAPAETTITHTVRITANTTLPDPTLLELNDSYAGSSAIVAEATTSEDGSVQSQFVDGPDEDDIREHLRLRLSGNVSSLSVQLILEHPTVAAPTAYQLVAQSGAPAAVSRNNTTAVVSDPATTTYQLTPVGEDRRAGPTGEFDRANSAGFVYDGAVVYQGERDTQFRGNLSPILIGVSGDTEGQPLGTPIAAETETGKYSVDGTNTTPAVTVRTPKLTTLRVENARRAEVGSGSVVRSNADEVLVVAQSNFEEAELLELTVTTPDGLDVTEEVISTSRVRAETDDGSPVATADESQPQSLADTPTAKSASNPRLPAATHERSPMRAQSSATLRASRTLDTTEVDPGESVTATTRITAGDGGRLSYEESFSPTMSAAAIESVTVNGANADPTVAAATANGLVVALQDLPAEATVVVTTTLTTEQSDETYQLSGTITSGTQRVDLDTESIVAGRGGSRSGAITSGKRAAWTLDLTTPDATEFTIGVSGSDDFTSESASAETDVSIIDSDPSLTIDSPTVSRGERPAIRVTQAVSGGSYLVSIPASDVRSGLSRQEYTRVFRNVEDTTKIGVITTDGGITTSVSEGTPEVQSIFAQLQIDPDDGAGVGTLRSNALAEDVTVRLHDIETTPADLADQSGSIETTTTLTVRDSHVSLARPSSYITGAETTLAGTTSAGTDRVVVYVRANDQFVQVDLDGSNGDVDPSISVSGQSFSRERVVLSNGDTAGNTILSLPGTYQLGLRTEDSLQQEFGHVPSRISLPDFVDSNGVTTEFVVQNATLALERTGPGTSVASSEQTLRVNGTHNTQGPVGLVAIGPRGQVVMSQIETTDQRFETGDFSIARFNNGPLVVLAISPGRDARLGDGQINGSAAIGPERALDTLQEYIRSLTDRVPALSQAQLRERIRAETTDDRASDDHGVVRTVYLSDPQLQVDTVVRNTTGSKARLQVAGSTNLEPDRDIIRTSLRQNGSEVRFSLIKKWDRGQWTTSFNIAELPAGEYTVRVETNGALATRSLYIGRGDGAPVTQYPARALGENRTDTTQLIEETNPATQSSSPTSLVLHRASRSPSSNPQLMQSAPLTENTNNFVTVSRLNSSHRVTLMWLVSVVIIGLIGTYLPRILNLR